MVVDASQNGLYVILSYVFFAPDKSSGFTHYVSYYTLIACEEIDRFNLVVTF